MRDRERERDGARKRERVREREREKEQSFVISGGRKRITLKMVETWPLS